MLAWPELRTSARLLRAHPVISTSLGAAIVLSLCSVCAGVGAIVGPFFVCELYGVQLAAASGVRRIRGKHWIGAAIVVLCTVLVLSWAGFLSALGFGPDFSTADAADAPLPWPDALRLVGQILGSTALAAAFTAPFLYAPLILIDRGGRIGGAVAESAWLVARDGALRTMGMLFAIYLLQLSPALLGAMFVARTFERAATPLGALAALPLLTISIPLGQGLLTASYLGRRALLASPRVVIARGRPPRSLAVLFTSVIVAPIAGLTMLGLAATRPSPPRAGPAPEGEIVADRVVEAAQALIPLDATTLAVRVVGREVSVLAGDDGVTARLPSAWRSDVERVRIARRRDLYAIEIHAAGSVHHTRIDRAGVRVDDSIRRRLEVHVPLWALACILAAFAACGGVLVRALAPLGSLRAAAEGSSEERRRAREWAHRAARNWGLVLAPFAIASLVAGLVSIGWR